MVDFTEVKHKNQTTPTTEVWWKDCVQEQRAYTYFAQKLAECYENFTNKAKFFRPYIAVIFQKSVHEYLNLDSLVKGFFFIFVMKDFIIREILMRISDQLPFLKERRILDQVELDYKQWMN